jgi:hypothetical protein
MATLSDRLAYILSFDTSDGVKSLKKLGDTADKELSKVEKWWDKAAAGATKFGAAALAFSGVAAVGLYKLASGASDARQNFQALEQVVGTLQAEEFKEWADGAAQAIGTSSSKAVEAATSFAQLGKLAGVAGEDLVPFSTNLVKLSADLAAFKNVNPEQALQDIRSGFSGSVEVMRKYGIYLDEHSLKNAYFQLTGERVTGTLTAQQRVLSTNAELFRQGADMLGQFERESDSLVGQTNILKAELKNLADNIGEGVLPYMTAAVTVAGDLAQAFNGLSGAQKKAIGGFATLGVGAIALVGTLSFLAGQGVKLVQRFAAMKAASERLTAFLDKNVKVAKGLGAGFLVASVALAGYTLKQRQARIQAEEMAEAIDDLGRSTQRNMTGSFVQAFTNAIFATDSFEEAMAEVVRGQPGVAQTILDTEAATGKFTSEMLAAGNSAEHTENMLALLKVALVEEKEAIKAAADNQEAATVVQDEATGAVEAGATALESLNLRTGELAVATETARPLVEYLSQAIKDSKVDVDALVAAYKGHDEAIQGVNENLEDAIGEVEAWRDGINAATSSGAAAFDTFEASATTSVQDYIDSVYGSNVDLAEWQEDLITIAEGTSADFAAHLAEMGPAAAGMVAEIAEGGPAAQQAFDVYTVQAAAMSRDMEAEFDKVGPGATEAYAEARRAAEVEASLMLVTIPPKAQALGEEFSKSMTRGINSFAGQVAAAAANVASQAARAGQNVFRNTQWSAPTVSGTPAARTGTSAGARASGTDNAPPGMSWVGEAGPELVSFGGGEKVYTAYESKKMMQGAGQAPGVTVQITGDIYGVPTDQFVAELAGRLNKYQAGMA